MSETVTDSDLQLLARYTRDRAEDAFAEIVRRHLDLVHSAALRQVRSPQLAEEVAQSAFTDLARNAHRLAPDTILTAWLYQVTRRTAIDVVRREARRQLREQIAFEMNVINATAADWTHIEPLLDEAMHALDDTDRAAVLLRYFENKSLREVGATLGTSDDAAQKRVSRAVERLREFFAKRGVTVGTSGLVVVISANAVQAAPVGLALTISTAAALAGTTITTAATATQAIAMTTLQKTVIAVTIAAAVGTGIYGARQASNLRTQVEKLRQEQAPLAGQIEQLTRERDDAAGKLAALRDDNDRLNRNTSELMRLRSEVTSLREKLRAASDKNVIKQPTTNPNSLEEILKILRDKDATEAGDGRRYEAAKQLRNLGPQAVEGLSAFRELLHSGNQETSYAGARALAFTSEASPEAFQELSNALSDPDAQVRDAAAHGVTLLFDHEFKNLDADSTLPRLVQNLRDVDRTVRADTAVAIGQYIQWQKQMGKGAEPELVIPALIQNLEDEWRYARLNAVRALQEYGNAANAAIPQLRKLLQDPDPQVQSTAKGALERISKVNPTLK